MIDHLSIGVRDLAIAGRFYDAVLVTLGYRCRHAGDETRGYGADDAAFWIVRAEQPVIPDDRSGLHICFAAPDPDAVRAFHAAALAAGGTDNGAPGLRPAYGPDYFAAFIIDPDGYRIEAYSGPRG